MSRKGGMLYGSNPRRVIDAIRRRAEARRRGDDRPDGRKLALVVEGGGMRGVHSGAGAEALGRLGYTDVFDEVYATSAGVMNASYFLTGQAPLGMSVYFENCTTWSFLNPFRFWKVLDIDYIVDRVVAGEKRLDIELLTRSPTRLLISACDAHTGEPVLIDTKSTKTPVLQVFRAAMALPLLYHRTVDVDGRRVVDGGTVLPFPLHHALRRDCTDVLVLLTRPARFVETPPTKAMRRVFDLAVGRKRSELCRAFATRHRMSQDVRDLALGRTRPPPDVNVAAVCPDDDDAVESTTTRRAMTRRAADAYASKISELFG